MTPVRLKPVAPSSQVKHSIIEPLRSLHKYKNLTLTHLYNFPPLGQIKNNCVSGNRSENFRWSVLELLRVCIKKKIFYFSTKTHVVGTQKNRLYETVPLSTQNICFCLFDLILYVPSTIFQLNRDRSSWIEPGLS